jgi:hypothetical protein
MDPALRIGQLLRATGAAAVEAFNGLESLDGISISSPRERSAGYGDENITYSMKSCCPEIPVSLPVAFGADMSIVGFLYASSSAHLYMAAQPFEVPAVQDV